MLKMEFLMTNQIEHSPILPASPWWGGFYERLVRSVMTPLKKVVTRAKLNYEEMETVIVEIEGLINSRPLTYLYEDNVDEPLTPSHLISGRNIASHSEPLVEVDAMDVTNRFKYVRTTIESCWKRFQHEYLTELREHHQHTLRRTNTLNRLKVGDVCIIIDDGIRQRVAWRLGRVLSLVVGRDGCVRGAMLETLSPLHKRSLIKRPIQKLIPLEVIN